jgi:hypothetical protein
VIRRRVIAIVLPLLLGVGVGTAWAAFNSVTSNGPNSFSAASDTTAPTAGTTTGARSSGAGTVGQIRQGTGYYIYANVNDASPSSGISSVTANLSTFDTGVTAAALTTTGGPWTVGGTTYSYRTALLTANTPLTTGQTYSYSLTMTDVAANSRTTGGFLVTVETYNSVITGTSGLLGHWRLGETPTVSDELNNTAGVLLQNHTGQVGASWTRYGTSTAGTDGTFTNENRLRRDAGGAAMYYASGVPSSGDYSVQADVHIKSVLSSDAIAVIGRASTTADTYYLGRYISNGATAQWEILRVVNAAATAVGTPSPATLNGGSTYSVRLEMTGLTIRLLVNGAVVVSGTDTGGFTTAGRGGVRFGFGGSTGIPTDTAGFHLDNVSVVPNLTAVDGPGTNDGSYTNGVLTGFPGALAGDANTAAKFDGTNDYITIARQISGNFSIEFWFKSAQGLNTNAQWWGNAGLVDAEVSGATADFGVSLRSDGRITAGVGTPDVTIMSALGLNNNAWHHVVFTRQQSNGALTLYVNGSSVATGTGSTGALTAPASIHFGRILAGTNYLAGTIDEVAIYNTVLSLATVDDHHESGFGS